MNSVHEPGSRTMSKNRLRNNIESNRIENRPSAPSAQPVASLRTQAARAWLAPCLPAVSSPPAETHAPARLLMRLPASPARARVVHARLLCAPRAYPSVVSRHNCLSCDTGSPVSCHNTPGCIAIQPCLLQPFQPQYTEL